MKTVLSRELLGYLYRCVGDRIFDLRDAGDSRFLLFSHLYKGMVDHDPGPNRSFSEVVEICLFFSMVNRGLYLEALDAAGDRWGRDLVPNTGEARLVTLGALERVRAVRALIEAGG